MNLGRATPFISDGAMKRSLGPFLLLLLILLFSRPPSLRAPLPRPSRPHSPLPVAVEAAVGEFEGPAEPPAGPPPGGASEPVRVVRGRALPSGGEPVAAGPLSWLVWRQNPDGSWGEGKAFLEGREVGRVAQTSMALLALLGAGYTHLSKERFGDRDVASAVRRAVLWLSGELDGEGRFRAARDGALEQALGALALGEMAGMTHFAEARDSARKAIEGLERFQGEDGSFGDAAATDMALLGLYGAGLDRRIEIGGVVDRLRAAIEARERVSPDAGTALFRVWFDPDKEDRRVREVAEAIAARPVVFGTRSPYVLYREAHLLLLADGPSGELWRAWSPGLRETLRLGTMLRSWEGAAGNASVLEASLLAMTRQVYLQSLPNDFLRWDPDGDLK